MDARDPDGGHIPVLPRQVLEVLNVSPGEVVVDLTVGLGGHAALLAERLGAEGVLIGLDMDPRNLEEAERRLAGRACRVVLHHANFADLGRVLAECGVDQVDAMLADLGVASPQVDEAERGFSFLRDGPLDMRMDPRLSTTAADLVNRMKERELGDLIYFNAQEPAARRIAQRICAARRESRITTTGRLADVIAAAVGVDPRSRKSKIHPATLTFQALRMAVNDEIGNLRKLLAAAPSLLAPGGRLAIIAFHSVEDKVVKLDFRARQAAGVYQILTKKPLIADEEERRRNPRSRSAKLRGARREAVEPEMEARDSAGAAAA